MRRFLAAVYAFRFFDYFLLIFPLYAVMFADAGLTPVQIGVALTAWSATTFLVQIPAGVLADRMPRRLMLALAQAALAACFAVWLVWPHFWGFLVGLVLWGFKTAFTSGTFEALLYDELRAEGREAEYVQVFGRTRALQAVALILAALGAAATARWGYGVALIASIAACGVSAAAALAMPPARRSLSTNPPPGYFTHLRHGLSHVWRDPAVLSLIAFSAVVLALGQGLEEFWPIFGVHVGVSRAAIAIFVAVQQALEAWASLSAHRLGRWPRRRVYGLFGLAGVLLAAAALIFNAPAMALLALYSGLTRLLDVGLEGRLQQQIPSESRATIGAAKGFATQVGVSGMYMMLGPLAQATSYQTGFLACGLVAIAAGGTWFAFTRRGS